MIQGWYCKEKLDASNLKGLKGWNLLWFHDTLTVLSGLQFFDAGSGGTGDPSRKKPHVSLGTSGRYLAMISAVSTARIKVEQTNLVYLKSRSLRRWPVMFACCLKK